MSKRLILMLAVLLVAMPSGSHRALAAVQTGERAAAAAPGYAQAIAICRAIESGHADDAKAAIAALPEAARQTVLVLCLGYHQALADIAPAQQLSGGTSI